MLAVVRNVTWGTAVVVASFLAVALADCMWIVLFISDPRYFFFGPWGPFGHEPSIAGLGIMESLLGLAVVIWLIGRVIRRASRSISARP